MTTLSVAPLARQVSLEGSAGMAGAVIGRSHLQVSPGASGHPVPPGEHPPSLCLPRAAFWFRCSGIFTCSNPLPTALSKGHVKILHSASLCGLPIQGDGQVAHTPCWVSPGCVEPQSVPPSLTTHGGPCVKTQRLQSSSGVGQGGPSIPHPCPVVQGERPALLPVRATRVLSWWVRDPFFQRSLVARIF